MAKLLIEIDASTIEDLETALDEVTRRFIETGMIAGRFIHNDTGAFKYHAIVSPFVCD